MGQSAAHSGTPVEASASSVSTRDAILVAARSLALDVGFRRTTVADVARRAGVSRMTVYREFADIAAIWSRLLTDELVGLLSAARQALSPVTPARTRIVALAIALIEGIPEHPLFRRALEVDPQVLLPLIVTRFGSSQKAMLAELDRLLDEGRQDGSVRADLDVEAAAGAILVATQSFVFSARSIDTLPQATAIRAQLPAMIDRYLAA